MLLQDPATLTRSQRLRVWIGNFVVDYVETFVGLLPAGVLTVLLAPALQNVTSLDQAKVAVYAVAVQIIGPALSALVSAGRRALLNAWPSLKAFFASGFGAIK